MGRARPVAAGVVACAFLAAACGPSAASHGEARPPGGTTTTTSSTTAVPPPTVERQRQDAAANAPAPAVGMVRYASCAALLATLKAQALAEVGPEGLFPGPVLFPRPVVEPFLTARAAAAGPASAASTGEGAAAAPAAAAAPGASAAADAFSPTNDQEPLVDEPDLVKTDGALTIVVLDAPVGLQVIDTASTPPSLGGFLPLPGLIAPEAFLLGPSTAVVIGTAFAAAPQPQAGTPEALPTATTTAPVTEAVVGGLADPAHPEIERTFALPGTEVGARLVAGRVLVVLDGEPRLPLTEPPFPASPGFSLPAGSSPWATGSGGTSGSSGSAPAQAGALEAASAAALAHNRAVIEDSTLADWLPPVRAWTPAAGRSHATVFPQRCVDTYRPIGATGFDTVSVVSLDPSSDAPASEVTVVGDASVVYASAEALFLAAPAPRVSAPGVPHPKGRPATSPPARLAPSSTQAVPPTTTAIYAFDLSDPAAPRYLGAGVVPGTLLGPYAMSEYEGFLRVATTTGTPLPAPGEGLAPVVASESLVTVLAPEHGALVPVGELAGLGPGERIDAVRFEGPLGYVVTFRAVDPLFVLDLSNPEHPALAGALHLEGFSSFLEPLGGGLLLGVGEAVDARLAPLGLQVSVFDVHDPAAPTLVSRMVFPGAFSPAMQDPHALLWWPPDRLVALPLDQGSVAPGSGQPQRPFSALVLRVGTDGSLAMGSELVPPATQGCAGETIEPVERIVVANGLLDAVTGSGVLSNRLDTLAAVAWLPFSEASCAGPPPGPPTPAPGPPTSSPPPSRTPAAGPPSRTRGAEDAGR